MKSIILDLESFPQLKALNMLNTFEISIEGKVLFKTQDSIELMPEQVEINSVTIRPSPMDVMQSAYSRIEQKQNFAG